MGGCLAYAIITAAKTADYKGSAPSLTMTNAATNGPTVFSVTELNAAVRELLEHSFGLLWVEGEISNVARPRSGHIYISLKDGDAQVRCALFRGKARLVRTALDNGAQVRLRARVSPTPPAATIS